MSEPNPLHSHVLEEIEAYLTDGLSPQERAAFETHVANCPTCSAALAEARHSDAALRSMFGDARPSAGFEDRIIRKLRLTGAPRRRLIHPMVFRSAAAVAAAVLLTSAGVVVSSVAKQGRTGVAWIDQRLDATRDERAASNLRQLGRATQMYHHDWSGPVAGVELRGLAEKRPNDVEELRRKLAESEKDQKWGEANRLNFQLRDADPSDVTAYYRVPELSDKATRSLGYGLQGQQAQGNGKALGLVAGKPSQAADGLAQFG